MFRNTISVRSIVEVNYLMKKISQIFLTCTCASQWAPHKFFQGGKNDILLVSFRLLTMQRKTLYSFCAIKKMPNVTATVANRVLSEKIYTEQMFVLVSMNILILKTEFQSSE